MIARHIHTKVIYEGGKTYIGKIIGVHRNTLRRWEAEGKEFEQYNNYEVSFSNVIREKQNKGQHNKNVRF